MAAGQIRATVALNLKWRFVLRALFVAIYRNSEVVALAGRESIRGSQS